MQARLFWGFLSVGLLGLALLVYRPLLGGEHLIGADGAGALSLWATWFPAHGLAWNYDLSYNFYAGYPLKSHWLPLLSLPSSFIYEGLRPLFGPVLSFHLLFPLYSSLTALLGMALLRRHLPAHPPPFLAWVVPGLGGVLLAFNPLTYSWAAEGAVGLLGFWALLLALLAWEAFLDSMSWPRLAGVAAAAYLTVLMSIQWWNLLASLALPYAVYAYYRRRDLLNREALLDYVQVGVLLFALGVLIFPASAVLWSTYYVRYAPLEVWQGLVNLGGPDAFQVLPFALSGVALLAPWEAIPGRRAWALIGALNALLIWRTQLAPLSLIGDLFSVPYNPDLTQGGAFWLPVLLMALLMAQGAVVHAYKTPAPAQIWLYFAHKYLASVTQSSPPPNPLLFAPSGYGSARYAEYREAGESDLPPSDSPSTYSERGLGGEVTALLAIFLLLAALAPWRTPFGTQALPRLDYYAVMAAEPENYLVLNFPLAADSLANRVQSIPAYNASLPAGPTTGAASFHHKRTWGGLLPTLSASQIESFAASPLVRLLTFQLDPRAENSETEIIALRNELIRWRAGFVILQTGQVPPEFETALRGWFMWTDSFCPVHQEGDYEFWRARWHPGGCPAYQITLGGPAGELAAGEGWHGAEVWDRPVRWAGRGISSFLRLWVTAPASDYRLTIRAQATGEIPGQRVEVWTGGTLLGEFAPGEDWGDYEIRLPRLSIPPGGMLPLELRHRQQANLGGRDLTAVYEWIRLDPILDEGEGP
jgi:hypothetical protein